MSKLMHHAYLRIKNGNLGTLQLWDTAVGELSKGDHYILVFCRSSDKTPHVSGSSDSFTMKLLGGVVLFSLTVYLVLPELFGRYGFHWRGEQAPTTVEAVPSWAQKSIIFLLLAGYAYLVVRPWIFRIYRNKRTKQSS